MKIIISHDVDHLYSSDHFFRDLILPKLIVRSVIAFARRKITAKEAGLRCLQIFRKTMNCIQELAEFDKAHGIPSTFFFGMDTCLGMSYTREKALPYIKMLWDKGFDCGVHGCEYQSAEGIAAEREAFRELTGREPDGIRMHYVRFDKSTFNNLDESGYLFDSTEFDKTSGTCVKAPYKVGNMWEFPVCVMDSYLPYDFEKAKVVTMDALSRAEEQNIEYFTVLLHDLYFGREYSTYRKWYEWFISVISEFEMLTFSEAVKELGTSM